jgi:type II secretion system protein G
MKRWLIFGIAAFVTFTIALYSYQPYKRMRAEAKKANDRFLQARKDMNMTAEALTRFKRDIGRYPTKDEGIKVLVEPPLTWTDSETALYKKWNGPYATSVREIDPWGNEYIYEPTPDAKEYKLKAVDPLKEPDKGIRVVVSSSD